MCGKFAQSESARELRNLAGAAAGDETVHAVTPMRFAHVIRLGENGVREVVAMRWGFSALSAQNPAKPDHIHARAETIDGKPTFRDAFRERRGVLVVESFNEGEEASPSRTIQHVVTFNDGKPRAVAVLWEGWRHAEAGELLTFVMVTVPANKLIGTITDRMPAILAADDIPAWLGEVPATADELKAMLRTVEDDWAMTPEKKPLSRGKPAAQGELF
jgi:putative SOS response-associated peptidase YedK